MGLFKASSFGTTTKPAATLSLEARLRTGRSAGRLSRHGIDTSRASWPAKLSRRAIHGTDLTTLVKVAADTLVATLVLQGLTNK